MAVMAEEPSITVVAAWDRWSASTVIESLLLERQLHFASPPFDYLRRKFRDERSERLLIAIRYSPYRPVCDIGELMADRQVYLVTGRLLHPSRKSVR